MKQMQNQRNDKGITLVALIITIIILVILAAVSISAVYNSRIVDYAVNGATDYAKESIKENEVMSGTESLLDSTVKKIEDILGGKTPEEAKKEPLTEEQLKGKIGEYVNYQPDTPTSAEYSTIQDGAERSGNSGGEQTISRDTNLKWRIMNVEGDKLTLISETIPARILTLNGANGYNNGVKLLNDSCNILYGNSSLGAIGRSLEVEDVNRLMGVTEDTKKSINSEYGKEYTPSNKYYPNIFAYEKTGAPNGTYGSKLGQSDQDTWYTGSTPGSTLKGTYTYYNYTLSTYKTTTTVQHALVTGQVGNLGSTSHRTYWLASRCVSTGNTGAAFYLFYVKDGKTNANYLYGSDTSTSYIGLAVRPCIEIDLNKVNIGETGSGESTDPYSIAKR